MDPQDPHGLSHFGQPWLSVLFVVLWASWGRKLSTGVKSTDVMSQGPWAGNLISLNFSFICKMRIIVVATTSVIWGLKKPYAYISEHSLYHTKYNQQQLLTIIIRWVAQRQRVSGWQNSKPLTSPASFSDLVVWICCPKSEALHPGAIWSPWHNTEVARPTLGSPPLSQEKSCHGRE